MAHVVFFEKPGCINNTRQENWLTAAGHVVRTVNILEHPWTAEELKLFFGDKAMADCFNFTAPSIKSGELNPANLSDQAALEAMVRQPLLIKRPLMIIDDRYFIQGFDKDRIHALIGLDPQSGREEEVRELAAEDLTTCPRLDSGTSCDGENEKRMPFPDLGTLMELVEEMGFAVSHVYEDLVFVNNTAFLFQFVGEKSLALFFNRDCPAAEAEHLEKEICSRSAAHGLAIHCQGTFDLKQKEGEENLELSFFDGL